MTDRTIRHIEHTRRIDILSEQELEDIREASLEVLERTGIEVAVRAHAEGAREGGHRDRQVDRVFKKCNEIVEPALLAKGGSKKGALVVTAAVKGDLHDLGKNMVGAIVKTVGFEVHDLGKDVPTEKIIDAVKELNPAIVGLSACSPRPCPGRRS